MRIHHGDTEARSRLCQGATVFARIHVFCADGEAKFWLDPEVELVKNYRLTTKQLAQIEKVIRERKDDIIYAWRQYFPGGSHQR